MPYCNGCTYGVEYIIHDGNAVRVALGNYLNWIQFQSSEWV